MARIARWMLVLGVGMLLIVPRSEPATAVALSPLAAVLDQAPPPVQGAQSLWLTGDAFHVRDGSIAFSKTAAGCTYATSSADFTADVQLPHQSLLLGLTYFFYDADPTTAITGQSRLELSRFDGRINSESLVEVRSSGSAGYGYVSATVSNGGLVNNQTYAYALDWYPVVTSPAMQLCAVRLDFMPQALAPTSLAYARIAGSGFHRRDRATDYGYRGGGCMFMRSAGGTLTADVNLPQAAELYGMQVYLKDQSASSGISVTLKAYNGLGGVQTLAQLAPTGVLTSSEYVDLYTDVLSAPWTVDQSTWALAAEVQLQGAPDENVRFCAVRLLYAVPEPQYGTQARFVAGTNFEPRDWAMNWTSDAQGCVSSAQDQSALAANLTLPADSRLRSLRHYFFDTLALNHSLRLERLDGAGGGATLALAPSQGQQGYGFNDAAIVPAFNTGTNQQGLTTLWEPAGTGASSRICGVQLRYSSTMQAFIPVLLR